MAVRRPLPFRFWGYRRFVALLNAWRRNKARRMAAPEPVEPEEPEEPGDSEESSD